MKRKIIYIEWVDACSIDEWTKYKDIKAKGHLIKSVGFLVKQNKDIITLALNDDFEGKLFSQIIHIPKRWIALKKII